MTALEQRVDHDIDKRRALGQYRARAITGHSRAVFSVQLEGGRLYSSSFDNTVRVRHSRSFFAVTSSNTDRFALSTMFVLRLQVWDIATGELLQVFEGHTGGVSCVRMQDGVLVSGSSDTTLVCNVPSGARMCIGNTGRVLAL
jgi:WD40 repeat protein